MQKKSGIMKSELDTMLLFLLDDLLNSYKVNLKFTVPQTHIFLYSYTFTTIQINFNKAPFIIESVKSQNITLRPEGAENMSLGFQVPDLCFLKQNCIRNLKMGSKQSISDATQ